MRKAYHVWRAHGTPYVIKGCTSKGGIGLRKCGNNRKIREPSHGYACRQEDAVRIYPAYAASSEAAS